MASELIAGLSAFKTMFDIAKSIKDLNDTVSRNAAVADLWEQIISAQTRYTTAIEQVGELKEKLTRFETWESEKKRYQLIDLDKGFFAFVLKEGEEAGEPPHAICTNCYQSGFKSILHSTSPQDLRDRSWNCAACKTQIRNQHSDMSQLIAKARGKTEKQSPASEPKKKMAPGAKCPKCFELELRAERSSEHPILGHAGARIHHLKCDNCGFADEKTV